jgi:hypothetical protein
METSIITALIAAGTSVGTVILIKPIVDKHLLKFQVKLNYTAEQSKKLKEHIGLHKAKILKSGELLNQRLKNFAKNHAEPWLTINGNYNVDNHYIDTTVYRFLSFFAEIQLLEKHLVYIDSTNGQKDDIRMLKYFRLLHEVMCDVDLFEGHTYDKNYQTDHFFTTPFYNLSNSLIVNEKVIDLDGFLNIKTQILPKIEIAYKFFDSINPTESRLRCERLKSFQIILIAFLNEFGYDYQVTPKNKYKYLKAQLGEYKMLNNLKKMVAKFKLNKFCGPIENVISNIK